MTFFTCKAVRLAVNGAKRIARICCPTSLNSSSVHRPRILFVNLLMLTTIDVRSLTRPCRLAVAGLIVVFFTFNQSAQTPASQNPAPPRVDAIATDDFAAAVEHFRNRRYETSLEAFGRIGDDHPRKAEADLYTAKSLLNLNRFVEAEIALRRVIAVHPASHDAAYLLGAALFRQGKARDALVIFDRATALKAPGADDLKLIALCHALLHDYETAALRLSQSIALAPDNLEALYYLGRVRFEQNDFDQAAAVFGEVLRRDPRHVRAQNNLGQSFEAKGENDHAIAAYRRAIELDRSSARPSELPLLNCALLLLQRDAIDEALALLDRAKTINPASAQVRFELGKLYLRLERRADAERELARAVELDPRHVGAHYQLGQLYRRLGKQDLSQRLLAISEQLRGNNNNSNRP